VPVLSGRRARGAGPSPPVEGGLRLGSSASGRRRPGRREGPSRLSHTGLARACARPWLRQLADPATQGTPTAPGPLELLVQASSKAEPLVHGLSLAPSGGRVKPGRSPAGRPVDLQAATDVCAAALLTARASRHDGWWRLRSRRNQLAGRLVRLTVPLSGTSNTHGNPSPTPAPDHARADPSDPVLRR